MEVIAQSHRLPVPMARVEDILSVYRDRPAYRVTPEEQRGVDESLRRLGLHLKIEGRSNNHVYDDDPKQMRYQFETLSQLHKILPENISVQYILFEVGGNVGYISKWLPLKSLARDFPSEQPSENTVFVESLQRIRRELDSAVETMGRNGFMHNDLFANAMIDMERRRLVLLEPAYVLRSGNPDLDDKNKIIEELEIKARTLQRTGGTFKPMRATDFQAV